MDFELRKDGYYYNKDGKDLGVINWNLRDDVMEMNHTYVDPSLRGQGVARKLLEEAVKYAQENDYRMRPLCSYVVRTIDDVPGGRELVVDYE